MVLYPAFASRWQNMLVSNDRGGEVALSFRNLSHDWSVPAKPYWFNPIWPGVSDKRKL